MSCHGFQVSAFRKFTFPYSQAANERLTRSACTCPGEDHPGPVNTRGRGAPEIDVFEQERNKTAPTNGVVSQSAQFAPFTANYLFLQDTTDEYTIYNPAVTVQNDYHGSAM